MSTISPHSDNGYQVYFYEAFEEEREALKRHLPGNILVGFTDKTIQESGDEIPHAPIISIRTQSVIPIEWANLLDGILSRSSGYDHLRHYLLLTEKPIPCGYLPLYCNRAVAEQAMLLWMALMRKLPSQTKQFRTFYRDGLTGLEAEHKTLLVVGVGNIGSEIVKIGLGLGMNVFGVDLIEKFDWVKYTTIETGIRQADIIVSSMNLTNENVGYFSYNRLKQAKRGVIFVNIARGELSPPTDLLKLLEEKHLGGVGLDVYSQESELATTLRSQQTSANPEVRTTLELSRLPNVILTPHNAFNTRESVERKAEQSISQIVHFLNHRQFIWPMPSIEAPKL